MVVPLIGLADGDEIINSLLCFEQFSNFYHNEYEPIKEKITLEWWIYPELWDYGFYAMCAVNEETGIDGIWLQWPPVTFTDSYLVAHEIEHVVRKVDNSSLKIIEMDLKYVDVAGCISSLLEDRIVDSILNNKYNFNLVDKYIETMKSAEESLNFHNVGSITEKDYLRLNLVHAGNLLRFGLINDDASFKRRLNKYKKIVKKNVPSVAKDGEELASEVLRIGLETREKRKQIFDYITNKYNLTNVLYVSES